MNEQEKINQYKLLKQMEKDGKMPVLQDGVQILFLDGKIMLMKLRSSEKGKPSYKTSRYRTIGKYRYQFGFDNYEIELYESLKFYGNHIDEAILALVESEDKEVTVKYQKQVGTKEEIVPKESIEIMSKKGKMHRVQTYVKVETPVYEMDERTESKKFIKYRK